jgi:hypothetical protein
MYSNPIPDKLRSDHLFLLIGTNPLPDWVAAQLLLRKGGQLYLVHSKTTYEVARRLSAYMVRQEAYLVRKEYQEPILVRVESAHKGSAVVRAIEEKLKLIRSGTVGLNYTGGTKVMSVHSYRAFEKNLPPGLPAPVFSYLQAPKNIMRFDASHDYPNEREDKVGLVENVAIPLEELFRLHEEFSLSGPERQVKARSIFEMLVDIHASWQGQRAWRTKCDRFLRYERNRPTGVPKKSPGDIKTDQELRPLKLSAFSPDFTSVMDALAKGDSSSGITLGEVVDRQYWEFMTAEEVAKWLDGEWLEHYVLQQIIDRNYEYRISDYGRDIRTRLSGMPLDEEYFQADVATMRFYQLHLLSCYTGSEKNRCKQKLFEAFTRVRQMGGDETRAALVCCSDDPRKVEMDIGQVWDIKDRVKVFGRSDLRDLGDKLRKWFESDL